MSRHLEPRAPFDGADNFDHAGYKNWLATRPAQVQELAKLFPAGTVIHDTNDDNDWYVIGWTEGDHNQLVIVPEWIWPQHRYHAAMAKKQYCCLHHIDDGEVIVRRYAAG